METQLTHLTFKNKVASFPVVVTTTRSPATVADLNPEGRWLKIIGADQIEKIVRVKVNTRVGQYALTSNDSGYTESGFEVTFKSGAIGFVNNRDYQELDALIVGTKGYLHGLAVFRKHSQIVGTPVPWFRAQRSARGFQNPNTAPRTCAAELYARAAGKPWA